MGRGAREGHAPRSSRPGFPAKSGEALGLLEDADETEVDDEHGSVLDQPLESSNCTDSEDLLFDCTEVSVLASLLRKGVPLDGGSSSGLSLIHHSALHNRRSVLAYLLDHAQDLGLDPNETDDHGCNCLFYCVRGNGGIDLLEMVTAAGVRFTPSTAGVTVLMEAALRGRLDLVRYLCGNGLRGELDTGGSDRNGWNALMYAASGGHADVFEVLVTYGVDWRRVANDGRTTLMQAAFGGHVALMEYILTMETRLGGTSEAKDNEGLRAIDYAVQGGQMDGFKFLLKRGSTICTTVNGSTVLMEAVNRNRLDFVDYLVSNAAKLGLDVQVRDKRGSNVLFYASSVGNPEIFRRLVDAGCSVENDLGNRTIYMQAALNGHLEMVKYLTANAETLGLKLEQTDNEGRNVLFYGVESGCIEVLKYLLASGIKCRADKKSKTNLMQAARAGNASMTEHLLAHAHSIGLDIHAVDSKGENALFYAVRSRRPRVVCALLDHELKLCTNSNGLNIVSVSLGLGLDGIVGLVLDRAGDLGEAVCSRDAKGRTALHHFVEQGDLDMLTRYGCHYRRESDQDLTGCSLLMSACKLSADARQMDLVRYLVEVLSVDVNQVDLRRRSALFYAVESGSLAATTYLLQRTDRIESDVNGLSLLMVAAVTGNHAAAAEIARSRFIHDLLAMVDRNGRNEVHYCAMHDCVAILDTLVPLRCSVDLRDSHGKTPLMYACENGRCPTVACLVRRALARVDLHDNDGRNALHYCFTGTNPSLHCARVLMQKGAEINLRDKGGITPLMLACQACAKTHIPLIRFLIEQGADPIVQDNDGSDAFDYCPFDSEYVKAILRERTEVTALEREALWIFQEKLSDCLHLNSVLRGLVKEGIFTKTLSFEVMKQPHVDRMRKLIEILCTRGQSAFRSFCLVLKKEGEIETSYELRKMAYRREVEIFW